MLGSPQLKPELLRRKKRAPKGARKKNETKFTRESELLILISRIMKARSREEARGTMRKNHLVNLVGRRNQMADRVGKGLTARSLFMRALVVRIMMKRSLIDRDRSHHDESRHSYQEAKMKELEEKYIRIFHRMDGEDPKMTAWEMLDDKNLPFTEPVRAYTMPDKFKMPRVEKYDGNGDPQAHLEAFREHIIMHGTPDAIPCRALP